MDKDKAIELLTAQQKKLHNSDVDSVWIAQTASLVREFLGDEVDEYTWIKNRKPPSWSLDHNTNQLIKQKARNEAIRFLKGCIDTVQRNGVYKKLTINFLYRIRNWQAISFIAGIAITLLSAAVLGGKEWGKQISDTQNIELRRENKELKEQTTALEQELKSLQVKNDQTPQ